MTSTLSAAPTALSPDATASSAASDAPTQARFAPWSRGTAARYVTAAVIAETELDARRVRLALPADRPVIARCRVRAWGTGLSVDVTGPHGPLDEPRADGLGNEPIADRVREALLLAAEHVGLNGNVTVTLSLPAVRYAGADLVPAACAAAVDALFDALDEAGGPKTYEALTAACPDVSAWAGPGHGHGWCRVSDGTLVEELTLPKFAMLLMYKPGAETEDVTTPLMLPAGNTVPIPAGAFASAAAAAEWLTSLAGTAGEAAAVLEVARDTAARSGVAELVLGAVGGHGPDDPIAVLLAPGPATVVAAQKLLAPLSTAVAESGRCVSFTRLAP